MDKMYFSVPYGTRELSFGIMDDEGGELWNFYVIFIESVTMDSRQVMVYGDYNKNGTTLVEQKLEIHNQRKGFDCEFEFEFNISETEKVRIYVCMSECQYTVSVSY